MKFRPVPLDQAEGKILGHNIAGLNGQRLLRKGKPLTSEQLAALRALGRTSVYVAALEADDVVENLAAHRIAVAVMNSGVRLSGAAAGRVNLLATVHGLLRVDARRLDRLNECEGVTLATLAAHTVARPRQIVATVKIIPFAVPEAIVRQAESIAAEGGPLLHVDALTPQPVSLIFTGSPSLRDRLTRDFAPLRERVEALDSHIVSTDFVPMYDEPDEALLAETLSRRQAEGARLIVLAGETAIMDRHDSVPRAIERAGGRVACLGAPVDPGNLLMLAYLGDTPLLGAPGCARSRKLNVVDWVLPRLLAGDRLTRADIVSLGHGGLLEDVSERPMPRDELV